MPTPLGFPTPADTTTLAGCAGRDRDLATAIDTYFQKIAPRRGRTNVTTGTGGAAGTVDVVFAVPFTTVPEVVATSTFSGMVASVLSITTTGFTLVGRRIDGVTGATTQPASWIAVGS